MFHTCGRIRIKFGIAILEARDPSVSKVTGYRLMDRVRLQGVAVPLCSDLCDLPRPLILGGGGSNLGDKAVGK
jgi:hypothetical protein